MPHVPDEKTYDRILADARHLLARSTDHERRLQGLVELLERELESAPAARQGGRRRSDAVGRTSIAELLEMIRQLCVASRDQRHRTEALLERLTGGTRAENADAAPRPRVLVVDDSDDTRELTSIALRAAGFDVATASDGLDGLIAASTLQPAVILMDVTMPILDGIAATRLAKSSLVTRHVPVIAHTANRDFLHGSMNTLFAGVLAKPAAPDAIVAAVKRLLSEERGT